ncbi:mechanosensitive ion channel family protein [Kribbella sp. VKM Ac-2568]|uniref:mechanosensitive ion channel family protein n=1 Tax=Kribbella sp. VKM Ac-2568 TaxID=2512219 RepID=UPI0010514A04|nr:mechanosensitive ion channel family protein [Kribbella sp. VKM Ac-2568]TCM43728.1 small conductance mechanosensitive channel [Kribbella sp. VKM Ac-2568]
MPILLSYPVSLLSHPLFSVPQSFPTFIRRGNDGKLEVTDQIITVPARILGLILAFFVLRWILHKAIRRFARPPGNGAVAGVLAKSKRGQEFVEQTLLSERRTQRAETIASLLCSTVTIVLTAILVVMVMAELGFNILPVVASASIIGVVLGFGAQTLVKDFLAGVFMIFEDQYGVGDLVDMEKATGVVEAVGLRVTRLRGEDGTTWYVRNGEVLRVGNLTTRDPDAPTTKSTGVGSAAEAADNPPHLDQPTESTPPRETRPVDHTTASPGAGPRGHEPDA